MINCEWINKALRVEFTTIDNQLYYKTRPCCHMHGFKIDREFQNWSKCTSWRDLETHSNRKHFIDWQNTQPGFHTACHPCETATLSGSNTNPINHWSKNDSVDYHILDVVVGNTCNLACPFCSPSVSSLIEKITNSWPDKESLPGKWGHRAEKNGNPSDVACIVSEFISNRRVGTLKVIGGEPLLAENWNEIGKVIDSGACRDMCLTFTTNATIMNKKIVDNLYKVKSSNITVSLDSINENYNFIRWPHKWDKALRNTQYLLDNRPDSAFVNIDNLVSVFNFEYLPDIIKVFKQFPSYSFNFDLKPMGSELDFKVLPEHILYNTLKKLNNMDRHSCTTIEYVLDNYKNLNQQHLREKTKNSVDWFLKQRGMSSQVLGKDTTEYLQL